MRDFSSGSLIGAITAAAAQWPDRIALREKRRGIWVELRYRRMSERIEHVAGGLRGLGIGSGATVVIASENTLDATIADLAVQSLGAATLYTPPRVVPHRLAAIVQAAGAKVAICGDQEQIDGIIAIHGGSIETIISLRPGASTHGAGVNLIDIASLEAGGRHENSSRHGSWDRSSEDIARRWIAAASSETFDIKSHRSAELLDRALDLKNELGLSEHDRLISVVSLARPAAALVDIYAALLAGAVIHFPESPATVADDLAEVQPTVFHANGRALALLRIGESLAAMDTGRMRGRLLVWSQRQAGSDAGFFRAVAYWALGYWTARKLGLANCRLVVTSDDGVHRKNRHFLDRLRLPVLQLSGSTAELGRGQEDAVKTEAKRLEDAAAESRYVRWAVVNETADDQTLSIQIEFEPLARWALSKDLSFSSYASLVQLDAVREMVTSDVADSLRRLTHGTHLPRIELLEREFDEISGELGADLLPLRDVVDRWSDAHRLRLAAG